MTTRTIMITEKRYKEIVAMDPKNAKSAMMAEAPTMWVCGFGIYGCRPVERDGVFQIEFTTGDSCD